MNITLIWRPCKMHPFVKWAGGKTQLLDKIHALMPKTYNRYFEPFIGGGALMFSVAPKDFIINDFNSELIQAYRCFTNEKDFKKLLETLDFHEEHHSEEHYYEVRNMDRNLDFLSLPIYERAARMIYLNKSCFNGLYRVNRKGYFNVPSGRKKTVNCYEKENLKEIYDFFSSSKPKIFNGDFQNALTEVKAGDFVYFDPPYDTWENKDSFTSYAKNPFGKEEQKRLAKVYKELSEKGAYVMLSNHNTEFIRELYKEFNIHVVEAKRMINSKASGRGNVEEVIITNYEN